MVTFLFEVKEVNIRQINDIMIEALSILKQCASNVNVIRCEKEMYATRKGTTVVIAKINCMLENKEQLLMYNSGEKFTELDRLINANSDNILTLTVCKCSASTVLRNRSCSSCCPKKCMVYTALKHAQPILS